jgi:glutathione S-transferase
VLLYDSPPSGNCYKVRLLLAHLGISYERRFVDTVDRSNRRDELDSLSPTRRVPTLVLDNGKPLGESAAILWYLGRGTQFVPEDRYESAKVLQWMSFELAEHQPALAFVRFVLTFTNRSSEFADRIAERTKAAHRALAVMERHLEEAPFFVGKTLSLADIALYAYTHLAHEANIDLEQYPAVRAWLDRVASAPAHVPIDA